MQALLIFAMKNTLGAAALAAFALTASRLFPRRPALTHVLWLMVLVKLVTPPVWWIPIHMSLQKPVAVSEQPVLSVDPHVSPAHLMISPSVASSARARIHLKELTAPLLVAIWIAGSLGLLLLSFVRIRRLIRALAMLGPSAELDGHIEHLAAQIGMSRTPRAFFTNATISPLVLVGLRRARLIVPLGLWERLYERQRDALLLHELAHVWRYDHWTRIFELAVTILYWWNPLVWLARRELRSAEERCCDAWVQWAMPSASDDYAATLVESAEFLSAAPPGVRLPALASGLGEFRQLHRRLLMIRECKTVRSLGWTWLLACAAMLVLPITLTGAQRQSSNEPAADSARHEASTPSTRPALAHGARATTQPAAAARNPQFERMLPQLAFYGVGLSDVIAFMRDVSGTRIFVDWDALDSVGVHHATPIALSLNNVRFNACLAKILKAAGGSDQVIYVVNDEGSITISTVVALAKQAGGFIRAYPVGDLIHVRGDAAGTLIETIVDSVDPTSWAQNGGSRTIRIQGDQLIVNQSPANQRAITSLLDGMRKLARAFEKQ